MRTSQALPYLLLSSRLESGEIHARRGGGDGASCRCLCGAPEVCRSGRVARRPAPASRRAGRHHRARCGRPGSHRSRSGSSSGGFRPGRGWLCPATPLPAGASRLSPRRPETRAALALPARQSGIRLRRRAVTSAAPSMPEYSACSRMQEQVRSLLANISGLPQLEHQSMSFSCGQPNQLRNSAPQECPSLTIRTASAILATRSRTRLERLLTRLRPRAQARLGRRRHEQRQQPPVEAGRSSCSSQRTVISFDKDSSG